MTNINTLSNIQFKRRKQFKDKALLNLKNYTQQLLKEKISPYQDHPAYAEWKDDYHTLLEFGHKFNKLTPSEYRLFLMALYSWMPVLYSQSNSINLRKTISEIIDKDKISPHLLDKAKQGFVSTKHINGSISAVSKLLHFIRPSKYAAWDTNVAKVLGRASTGNNSIIYIDYLAALKELVTNKGLSEYFHLYRKEIDKTATKMRAIEHGLFILS